MRTTKATPANRWAKQLGQFCSTGWFRGIISAGLLAAILGAVDLGSTVELLKKTDYVHLALALAFFSANKLTMACRWNVLTQVKGLNLSIVQSLKISLISNFVGSFLPGGVGGDVYRIYRTSKREKRTDEVAASVVMERFVGMLTRSLVAVLGVLLILNTQHQTPFGRNLYAVVLGFCALGGLGFWLSLGDGTVKILMRLIGWWGDHWVLRQGLKFQKAYVDYKTSFGALLLVFLLSLIGIFLVSVANYFAARALDINVGLVFYFGIVSIINIVGRIPVSVGGLGITEGSYVVLFSTLGVSSTEAFTLALLVRLTGSVFAVAGWVLYVTAADSGGHYSPEVRTSA